MRRFLTDDRIATLARVVLGGLFVYAGLSKLDAASFAQDVNNYRLLPASLVNFTAMTLPTAEILAGGMLLVGLRVRASALVVLGLLAGFTFAMSWAWAKGIDIECGCFGKGTKVGFRAIAEDLGMALLGVHAYLFDRGRFAADGLVRRARRRS